MLTQNMLALILLCVLPLQISGALFSTDNKLLKTWTRDFCDEKPNWSLVKYTKLHVQSPTKNVEGIRALENSCITFPYQSGSDSSVIIHVFWQVSSISSGIDVSLFKDAETSPYETYIFKKTNDALSSHWYDLIIHVAANTQYIRFTGTSSKQDIVIVDSFKTISNDLMDSQKYIVGKVMTPVEIIEEDESFIFQNAKESRNNDEDDLDGEAITEDPVTENPVTEDLVPEDDEDSGFWTPLTISLISIAGVAVVAGLSGVAYYVGTSSSNQLLLDDFEEPPRTVTIPRVRDVYN